MRPLKPNDYTLPVRMTPNRDGSPNFTVGKVRFHSSGDPRQEARRLADRILASLLSPQEGENPDPIPLLIVGIGWGYLIEALHEKRPHHPFLFYEPIPELHSYLSQSGRVQELKQSGSPLLHSPDEIRKAIKESPRGGSLSLFITPTYRRLFPGLEQALLQLLQSGEGVEEATRSHFMATWIRNYIHHLTLEQETLSFLCGPETEIEKEPNRIESGGAKSQKGENRSEGIPLFCGGGPTLMEELKPYLSLRSEERKRVFLMAADTALGPLLRNGIQPDLAISIDSGRGTLFHLLAPLAGNEGWSLPFPFPVLTYGGGAPFLSLFFQRLLYFRSTFPLDQLLAPGPLRSVPEWNNPSGNVAGLALPIARHFATGRLYLAGVGFRSFRGSSHARGTGYALYSLLLQNRIHPAEMYGGRGYGRELTGKNSRALQELLRGAKEGGIDINFLNSSETEFLHNVAHSGPLAPRPLPLREVPLSDMRSHLLKVRARIDWEEMARIDPALSEERMAPYFTILQNHNHPPSSEPPGSGSRFC